MVASFPAINITPDMLIIHLLTRYDSHSPCPHSVHAPYLLFSSSAHEPQHGGGAGFISVHKLSAQDASPAGT
eukprot:4667506-Pyramimonas_sp.AAC.1